MKFEKSFVVSLTLLVLIATGVTASYLYFKYIYKEEKIVGIGDCIEIEYVGRYASNNTVFDTNNETVAKENKIYNLNRTYQPLRIFVDLSGGKAPPSGYENFSSGVIKGLLEGVVGMKEGEKKTITIPPEKGYGVKPKIGDTINLTPFMGTNSVVKIIDIKENVSMPTSLQGYFGNGSTTLYVLRQEQHYVGEVLPPQMNKYPSWRNSSMVTKINETKIWIYITPTVDVNENFTWVKFDEVNETFVIYPENKSRIIEMTNDTITIFVTPEVNDTITIQGRGYSIVYMVENVTADKINTSYTDKDGNKAYYREFNRTIVIDRNQTLNITTEWPREMLQSLLGYMRSMDPSFQLSLDRLAGETLIFEVTVEKIYKTSQES